jgi:rubrerythrin
LVNLIREQVEIEKESAARLSETEQKVGTGAAKLLLVEMKCDSQKHAAILEAVLEALKGAQSSKPLWQQAFDGFADPVLVKREIENHKTLGKSMVAHIQKEVSKTDDEAVRTLLMHLTEDEKRHSEILDEIVLLIALHFESQFVPVPFLGLLRIQHHDRDALNLVNHPLLHLSLSLCHPIGI